MAPANHHAYDGRMNPRDHKTEPKVILITGASSGIGWATAERLHQSGHRVFGTSRTPDAQGPEGVTMLPLDVERDESVRACVGTILSNSGHIDVLVSNAGRLIFGPSEEVPLVEAQRMFETNFWGTVRMVNTVLPGMRARGEGHLILISSMAAWVALPLNGFYAASKAALSRYAESLRHETMHLGLHVALVEPGEIATPFWENALHTPSRLSEYVPIRDGLHRTLKTMFRSAPPPGSLATIIEKIATSADPDPVYRFGGLARRIPWMRVLFPARFFERGLRRNFGLDPRSKGIQAEDRA